MGDIWARFRRARQEILGCSQRELAKRLGDVGTDVSGSSISQYEQGKRDTLNHDVVRGMARLGVNPMWLLDDEGPPELPEPLAVKLLYEVVRRAVDVARNPNLRDPEKQKVLRELLALVRSGDEMLRDEE